MQPLCQNPLERFDYFNNPCNGSRVSSEASKRGTASLEHGVLQRSCQGGVITSVILVMVPRYQVKQANGTQRKADYFSNPCNGSKVSSEASKRNKYHVPK
jgi:hypothetical protein